MSLERGSSLEIKPVDNAPSVAIGTVTTLSPGSSATVTNVGSPQSAVLNIAIPQGAQGIQGIQGIPGTNGTNGSNGVSPNITIGSVTTLSTGSPATASLTGTFPNLSLNLGIPMGATGSGSSVAWGGITGTLSSQTDLATALGGKAATAHGHAISDVTGLQTALDAKAGLSHAHAISDVTGLQAALDAKAPLASPTFTGAPSIAGTLLGYRNLPTSRSISANDTLADADKGKKIIWTGGVGTLTLNPNATTPIDSDAIGTIVNDGSGNLTIARGTGVTSKLIGTGVSADRVVPPGCVATWFKTGTDAFYIGGANVT